MSRVRMVSIGSALPPRVVTTTELLAGRPDLARLPIERLTGVRARRWAAAGEQSLHLAVAAAYDCLARAGVPADDVDLVLSASISRNDGPGFVMAIEPASACDIAGAIGARGALCLDIGNACAGMFTGIVVAEAFLRQGRARRVLVVSGEHATHLTESALGKIRGPGDPLLASLTLGDAGAAVLLELSSRDDEGFALLELYTRSAWADACVGKPYGPAPGGALLITEPVRMAEGGQLAATRHALASLEAAGWDPEDVDLLVPHQTSRATIGEALLALDTAAGRKVFERSRVLEVLDVVGNTASTSHFVALALAEERGRLADVARIGFVVSGSGLSIGTALYERGESAPPAPPPVPSVADVLPVALRAVALVDPVTHTVEGSAAAVEKLLATAGVSRHDVGLLVFAGLLRTEFLHEPATAALIAQRADLSSRAMPEDPRRCLTFDVVHGGGGVVDALEVAARVMSERRIERCILVSAEVEPSPSEGRLGIAGAAGALLLELDERAALGPFVRGSVGSGDRRTSLRIGEQAPYAHRDPEGRDAAADRAAAIATLEPALRRQDLRDAVLVGPSDASAPARALAEALGIECCECGAPGERGSVGVLETLARSTSRSMVIVDAAPGRMPAAVVARRARE